MIENRLVPNVDIFSRINSSMPADDFSKRSLGVSSLEEGNGSSFKTILSGMVSNINSEIEKPDQLLNRQLTGDSEVDIHDVTAAIAKAELGISLASQVTSKVIAAYNSVMQISI